MDYERILSDLNPTAEWGLCAREGCPVEGLDVHSGRLSVPSNYDEPLEDKFSLYVERYTKPGSHPEVHVILLAGGPGRGGKIERRNAIRLVRAYGESVAVYLVDHRGVGDSGEFLLEGDTSKATPNALLEALEGSAFDVQDLIMTNAALDVAMVGMAVRKSTAPSARLVLRGFSYGARWAHHAVQLTPNVFDSAIFGGIPFSRVEHKRSLVGLAEACANDEFCRRKMGGDVYKAMNSAVRNLGNKDYNECTTLFHESLSLTLTGTVGERTRELSFRFFELLTSASKNLKESDHFRPQQLFLPLLMASEKCTNTAEYRTKVLEPILEIFSMSKTNNVTVCSHSKMGSVVNSAILLDVEYQDFPNGLPEPLSDHTDLHPVVYYSKSYYQKWEKLSRFLTGRKLSEERPAITSKTAIYIMASRMDLNTTYMSAWSLFESIVAPTKKWLLFDNRGHYDGYWGECHDYFEWEALFGKSTGFNFEECVRRTDTKYKLDWTFSKYGKYSRIWDCVPDSKDLEGPSTTPLPAFQEWGDMGIYVTPPKLHLKFHQNYHPATPVLVLLMVALLLMKLSI